MNETKTFTLFCLFMVILWNNRLEAKVSRCGKLDRPLHGKLHKITKSRYRYTCNTGFKLAGVTERRCKVGRKRWTNKKPRCQDIDECKSKRHPCSQYADCINGIGSFDCICRPGYTGDGRVCTSEVNLQYLLDDDTCGVVTKQPNDTRKRIRRIIGGQYSQPGEWPWMALITVNGGPVTLFSGVLIKPGWVLTIASLLHVDNDQLVKEEDIIVSLGENDRNKPENEEQQFRVRPGGIIVHERYSRMKSTRHDIALLRLEGKAEVTDYVNTICLVNKREARKYERGRHIATVSGWGITEPIKLGIPPSKRQHYSGVLQHIALPIAGPYKCKTYTAYEYHKKSMLCAGTMDNAAAPCIGDGGSPLTIQDPVTKRWLLLGLFSWSEGCGQPSKFSYYTRIAKYRTWIDSKIYSNTDS